MNMYGDLSDNSDTGGGCVTPPQKPVHGDSERDSVDEIFGEGASKLPFNLGGSTEEGITPEDTSGKRSTDEVASIKDQGSESSAPDSGWKIVEYKKPKLHKQSEGDMGISNIIDLVVEQNAGTGCETTGPLAHSGSSGSGLVGEGLISDNNDV